VPLTVLGQFARYPRGTPWPDVLARALGPEYCVISEGLPGRTTVHDDLVEGGKRSGLEVLPAILPSHAPLDLMLLMLGTNDLKPRFSVTAAEIARSIERLVVEARNIMPGLPSS
jgi:lysophospholipase L1-like esterase